MVPIPLDEWSGSGATKELHSSIKEFNESASKQTTTLTRLTLAIFILTVVMVAEVGFQIYLAATSKASAPANAKEPAAVSAKSSRPPLEFMGGHVGDSLNQNEVSCKNDRVPARLSFQICDAKTKPKIGSVRVGSATKKYLDGKLISWGFSFDFGDYEPLAAALSSKYGPPDTLYTGVTGDGAGRYEGKGWRFADGRVTISRASGKNGPLFSDVAAESETGFAELRRRDAKAKAEQQSAVTDAILRDLGGRSK